MSVHATTTKKDRYHSPANNFLKLGININEKDFSKLSPEDQEALILEADFYATKREENPLAFFVPNGAQEEFINAIGNSNDTAKRIFISTAGNGVGKSACAISILGNFIFGPQTMWFDKNLFTWKWKFPKKIWYLSEHDAFQNKLSAEIRKWFPKDRYTFIKAGKKYESHLESDTGWTMDLMTYDQDVTQFEAADIGILLLDEPPPRNIYTAAITRMRMGGICLFVMTPLSHSAWVFDDLIENKEQQKYVQTFYADVENNCIQHGVRGRLSHSQIEFIASQYDEDEKEARLHGKPKHLSGKIYKQLHPSQHRHFLPAESFFQSSNTIYCAMDIHDRRPPMIVWIAANTNGKMYVVDEYPNDPLIPYHTIKSTNLTFNDFASIIVQRERANGWDPQRVIRVMDPNYGRRQMQALGRTIQEFFADAGLYFITDVNDDLFAGHGAVKNRLAIQHDQKPGLLIGDTCYNLWFQMTRYGIKENSTRKSETDGLSERVAQKYKDGPDALRYGIMIAETPETVQEIKKEPPKSPEHDLPPVAIQVPGWRDPWTSSRSSSTSQRR